jgi:type IV secretory pathway TrbD component
MAALFDAEADAVPGFHVPVHRALTEPILLGGAPRTVAIANGTLAAAIAFCIVGHSLAVWGAKRDPLFVEVARRHLRYPAWLRA